MILLVCKESSTLFQSRLKKYLDERGLANQLILLQPFDLLMNTKDDLSIVGYENLVQKIVSLKSTSNRIIQETLETYLTKEDINHLHNTQWLNMRLGRLMYKDVTEEDCYKYLYIIIKNFEEVFVKYKPSTVFDTDIDNYARRVLYKICKKKGIPYKSLVHSRFEDFILVTDFMDNPEVIKEGLLPSLADSSKIYDLCETYKNKPILSSSDEIKITNSILRYKTKYIFKLIGQIKFTFLTLARKKIIFGTTQFPDLVFPPFKKVWAYNLMVLFHTFTRKIISRPPSKDSDYLYLPLSFSNEGVDSFSLGDFSSEFDFIQLLKRECADYGLKLFVRDHPHMIFERSSASEQYLNNICDYFENSIASCSTNSLNYMKNARYVVTLNGTTSLEAKIFGIPTFTFGKPLHEYLFDARPYGAVDTQLKASLTLKKFFKQDRHDVTRMQGDQIYKYIEYVERFGFRYSLSAVLRGEEAHNEKKFFQFITDKF